MKPYMKPLQWLKAPRSELVLGRPGLVFTEELGERLQGDTRGIQGLRYM